MAKEIVAKSDSSPAQQEEVWGQKITPEIQEVLKEEGLPLMGLTILGGKPYINVTGLDRKIKNICQEKGFEFSIEVETIKDPDVKNEDYLVGRRAKLTFFDKQGFLEALKKVKIVSEEGVKTLKQTFTYTYTGEGWATPDSCEAIAYTYKCVEWKNGKCVKKVKDKLLIENVVMMAERRATNRAKREATGTGLTSIDEIPLHNHIEQEEGQDYTEIEAYLDHPDLTEEEKAIIKKGIELRKPAEAIKEWVEGILAEKGKGKKPKKEKKQTQEELFYKLLKSHTLTEEEKEIFTHAFEEAEEEGDKEKKSAVINELKDTVEQRKAIERLFGCNS